METSKEEFEELLRKAVIEYHQRELDAIPDRETLRQRYALSEQFYEKMEKLKKRQAFREKARCLKAAAIALAVLSAAVLASNGELQAKLKSILTEWLPGRVKLIFETETGSLPEDQAIVTGYLPEGYQICNEEIYPGYCVLEFQNEEGDLLSITRMINQSDTHTQINDEAFEIEETVMEDGEAAYFFRGKDGESNILVWNAREKGYNYTVDAYLGLEEMKRIAADIM